MENLNFLIQDFIMKRKQCLHEGKIIVSIDETSFGRNSKDAKGYAIEGKRLFLRKKQARLTTSSVVACLSQSGKMNYQIFKKAINSVSFIEFLNILNLPSKTALAGKNDR